MQDGTQLQFMSVTQKRYLVADKGGGAAILADRMNASGWETFRVDQLILPNRSICTFFSYSIRSKL